MNGVPMKIDYSKTINEQLPTFDYYKNRYISYELELMNNRKELERLNNIINELEKELKEDYKNWMCNSRSNGKYVKFGIDTCKRHFYNRLQELKGIDKE